MVSCKLCRSCSLISVLTDENPLRFTSSFIIFLLCSSSEDPCARASCNHGTCLNEGASYRCECHRGYEGSACDRQIDPCSTFVCYNGGACVAQQDNQPVCQCAPGYRGPNCYESDGTCISETCMWLFSVSCSEISNGYIHL